MNHLPRQIPVICAIALSGLVWADSQVKTNPPSECDAPDSTCGCPTEDGRKCDGTEGERPPALVDERQPAGDGHVPAQVAQGLRGDLIRSIGAGRTGPAHPEADDMRPRRP